MVKVAMIGVGAISGIYLKNITNVFKEVELVGVCDLIPERAEKGVQTVKEYIEAGAKAPVPKIYKDMYEAFNDPEVEVVLNLTRPYEHYGVTKAALEHGKHVFSEKPLAADMEEGAKLMGRKIDVAFLVLDPRQESYFWWGFDWWMRTMQVQLAFPMHSWESFSLTQKLKALPCSEPYRDRVMEIFYNGQSFLLEE